MDFSPGFRVAYSTDRGQTWIHSSIGQSANQFPMPIVYPNGDVMVTYYGSGVTDIRSTNGGVGWGGVQTISSISDPNCPPDDGGSNCSTWRLNAIPAIGVDPRNGDAVVTWADGRNGTATIYYSRSTDNGAT